MTELLQRGLKSLRDNGDVIYIHNLARPLKERAESRKVCGPYMWKPATPGTGRGFYQASDSLACDPNGGSTFALRLALANDHIQGRLSDINGYYCDEDGDGDTLKPIIARLPHGRGFLAGWTMGAGMCATLSPEIYTEIEEAARAAHHEAERDAEEEQERDREVKAGDMEDEEDETPEREPMTEDDTARLLSLCLEALTVYRQYDEEQHKHGRGLYDSTYSTKHAEPAVRAALAKIGGYRGGWVALKEQKTEGQ